MSLYATGTITGALNATTITGTGTKWSDAKLGITNGSVLFVSSNAGVDGVYQVKRVISDTSIELAQPIYKAFTNSKYSLLVAESASTAAWSNQLAATLGYYQAQMDGWQQIMTGTGDVALTAPDGTKVTIKSFTALDKDKMSIGAFGLGLKKDSLPDSLNGSSGFFGAGSYSIEKSPAVVIQSSYGAERRGQFGINMANNAFFRFCNTPSDDPATHPWKQLVSQGEALLTIDKLFVTSDKNELIRLKTTSKQNYIIGVAADNSAMWYVGNASDANNNVYLNNYKGFNSIAMLDDGTIELKTKESKGIIYTNAAKLMVANSDASNRSIAFGVAGTTSQPSENGSINLWGATSTPFVMEFVTGSAWLMYLRKNADSSRTLLMNGNITCTTLTQTSDRDLKDNLEIIPDALGKLSKLNGYTYNWKETGIPSAGIIAQEVMEVLPDVISTVNHGASRETYIDESGEEQSRVIDPSAQERHYAVEYSGLIGLLVAGINEERKIREAMELQVTDLTNRLESLEKSLALILVK